MSQSVLAGWGDELQKPTFSIWRAVPAPQGLSLRGVRLLLLADGPLDGPPSVGLLLPHLQWRGHPQVQKKDGIL